MLWESNTRTAWKWFRSFFESLEIGLHRMPSYVEVWKSSLLCEGCKESWNFLALTKKLFLSILHKRQRNIYSGIQKGFLGHLSYIQWQAFLHSIKNAVWDLHKQIKGVDMSPKTKPLRRMFSLCELTFKASQLSQFIVVVKIIPTEDIFHRISP